MQVNHNSLSFENFFIYFKECIDFRFKYLPIFKSSLPITSSSTFCFISKHENLKKIYLFIELGIK